LRTRDFVRRLYERYGDGLAEKLAAIRHHNVTSRARHKFDGGSTGNSDCGFLYLLVKAFQRRSIFEIGTFVGTSAVAMTMAGGQVTTCDPNDYGCLPSGIRFLNMPDDEALRVLEREAATIDMVFADWMPSLDAVVLINELSTPDMIFAAHDYWPDRAATLSWTQERKNDYDKGEMWVRLMSKHYYRAHDSTWILPEAEGIEVAPGLLVEETVATLIPNRLLAQI
jgi:predicted O-methyltransferase YrrM